MGYHHWSLVPKRKVVLDINGRQDDKEEFIFAPNNPIDFEVSFLSKQLEKKRERY